MVEQLIGLIEALINQFSGMAGKEDGKAATASTASDASQADDGDQDGKDSSDDAADSDDDDAGVAKTGEGGTSAVAGATSADSSSTGAAAADKGTPSTPAGVHSYETGAGTVAFYQEYAQWWKRGEVPRLAPKNLSVPQWKAVVAAVSSGKLPRGMFADFSIAEEGIDDRQAGAQVASRIGITGLMSNDTENYATSGKIGSARK